MEIDYYKQIALESLRANNQITDEELELLECFDSLSSVDKENVLSSVKKLVEEGENHGIYEAF